MQRYWINSQHYRAGGPIFFMFGGEGNAQGFVDAGIWMKFAQDFGAFVTCLEHRFYGESFPTLCVNFKGFNFQLYFQMSVMFHVIHGVEDFIEILPLNL